MRLFLFRGLFSTFLRGLFPVVLRDFHHLLVHLFADAAKTLRLDTIYALKGVTA